VTDEHSALQDLVAAYVLGAVTNDEAAEIEQHLPTCPECRRLERELREVKEMLPALAAEAEPSAALKTRLMAAVAAEPRSPGHQPIPLRRDSGPTEPAPEVERRAPIPPRARWSPRMWPILAVAAMVLVVIAGVAVWRALNSTPPTVHFAMKGTAAMASVRGTLAYDRSNEHLTLQVSGLRRIPATKVYELWLVRVKGATLEPTAIGEFSPGASGKAQLTASGHDVTTYNLAALTIERAPGSATPTFPLIAEGKVD
jgi:anti-sigma-K factor RskA